MARIKKGTSQFTKERNEYITALWKKLKKEAVYPVLARELAYKMAVIPVDRYFISEERAFWLISHKCKGMKNKYKDVLYKSFLDLYNDLRLTDKYKNEPQYKVIAEALSRPAPCLGLSPEYIYCHVLSPLGLK